MSVDLIVYLKRDKIPTHDPWQRAIDTEGFDLQLDAVDTVNQTGYWPAKLNGKDSGFEYSFGMAERWDEEEEEDELTCAVGDRDWIATFTTHSSLEEFQLQALRQRSSPRLRMACSSIRRAETSRSAPEPFSFCRNKSARTRT